MVFRSFRDGGGLYLVNVGDGRTTRIAGGGFLPRFSPDGSSIVYQIIRESGNSEIEVLSLDDGSTRQVGQDVHNRSCAIWSPDGRRLMFLGTKKGDSGDYEYDWWVTGVQSRAQSVPTGAAAELKRSGSGVIKTGFCASDWDYGQALFAASGEVWAVGTGADGRIKPGSAERLLSRQPGTGGARFLRMPGGKASIVYGIGTGSTNIWSMAVDGHGRRVSPLRQVTYDRTVGYSPEAVRVSVSEDGSKIIALSWRTRAWTMWCRDLLTGQDNQVATPPASSLGSPRLNAAGTRVAYGAIEGDRKGVYITNLASGEIRSVCKDCGELKDWSRDEKRLLLISGRRLATLDVTTGSRETVLDDAKYEPAEASFSPDGRWIALVAGVAGQPKLHGMVIAAAPKAELRPAPITQEPYSLSLHWAADGNLLYFFQRREDYRCLWAQRLDSVSKQAVGAPFVVEHFHNSQKHPWGQGWVSVSRHSLAVNLTESRGDIWIADASWH